MSLDRLLPGHLLQQLLPTSTELSIHPSPGAGGGRTPHPREGYRPPLGRVQQRRQSRSQALPRIPATHYLAAHAVLDEVIRAAAM